MIERNFDPYRKRKRERSRSRRAFRLALVHLDQARTALLMAQGFMARHKHVNSSDDEGCLACGVWDQLYEVVIAAWRVETAIAQVELVRLGDEQLRSA